MHNLPDYYEILGVSHDARGEDIQHAARALSERFPEEARDPSTNIAFRQLVEAYETLNNPQKRAAYDRQLQQQAEELLEVTILGSRDTMGAGDADQLLYLLATLRTPLERVETSYPINLCLVIDRSTSMRGARLERVQAAARLVVERLSPGDVLSIVSFSDRAQVVVPADAKQAQAATFQAINSIQPSGGTEILQGLLAGVKEMAKLPISRYTNHLVLLTDGHTYGDDAQCLQLAQEAAERGIAFSAFGIGTDWNDSFLDNLVAPSGGYSTYIEDPGELVRYLEKQVNELATLYAKNVYMTLLLPPSVVCKDIFKLAPFAQPLACSNEEISLGAVESNRPLSLLVELTVSSGAVGQLIKIPLLFRASIPAHKVSNRRFDRTFTLRAVHGEPNYSPPAQVIQAVKMLNLYRMNEKAWEEAQEGDALAATRRMKQLSTRLMEAGQTELAQQAMMETQRLAQAGTVSLEGRKRLKYQTRSLLTKTIWQDDDQV